MSKLSSLLMTRLQQAIAKGFGEEYATVDPLLRPTADPKFGDFQSNVAMSLCKQLGRNPREVATAIIAAMVCDDLCEPPQIAGPGFINIRLLSDALAQQLLLLAADARLGIQTVKVADTVVVDYSGPNVAKEMHVGHLRSTIIGDALAHVLEFLGQRVIRQNHLGDWGTQFGMLIQYLIETQWSPHADTQLSDLNALYKESKQRFDSEPEFAERSRARVVALQGGEPQSRQWWQDLVMQSRRYIATVYQRLDVSLTDADTRGESAYNDALETTVMELESQGLTQLDEGALVIYLPEFIGRDDKPLPLIIRKSDGAYLYATTDLACLRYRTTELQAKRIIYVTDARQNQHFAMVFKVAEKAGWLRTGATTEHVPFGSVLGEDGKPFKTRSGDTIRLVELIEEAERRAGDIVRQKNPEFTAERQADIANAVAIGAIKYADLCGDRVKDYVFSWSRMLAMEGNTAPYMQYVYTRVRSIFRKGLEQGDMDITQLKALTLESPAEKQLSLKLLQLEDVLHAVAQRLEPHRLCTYLFELATLFNGFYEHCPVLKADTEIQRHSRLLLCDLTARTLLLGLRLLGIRVVEQM